MTRSEYNLIRWYVRKKLSDGVKAKLAGHSMTEDDLVQECALWVVRYPAPQPVNRTTAICNACRWAIAKLVGAFNCRKRNYGRFEPLTAPFMAELVESKEFCDLATEAANTVGRYLSGLKPKRREVLKRNFGIGRPVESLTEIGNAKGVTREAVRQQRNAALADIRQKIG